MNNLYEYLEFKELSSDAKENAINSVRETRYEDNDIAHWVVDDDSLFEPSQTEMSELFGDDYYSANGNKFMIENTSPKTISFVGRQDQNYYLHCAKSIDVSNDNLFLRWLGIPPRFHNYVYYTFNDGYSSQNTGIDFQIEDYNEFSEKFGEKGETVLAEFFEKAEKKFDSHIDNVLTRISSSIDEEFEDERIIEFIESNDYSFDEDGTPAK